MSTLYFSTLHESILPRLCQGVSGFCLNISNNRNLTILRASGLNMGYNNWKMSYLNGSLYIELISSNFYLVLSEEATQNIILSRWHPFKFLTTVVSYIQANIPVPSTTHLQSFLSSSLF